MTVFLCIAIVVVLLGTVILLLLERTGKIPQKESNSPPAMAVSGGIIYVVEGGRLSAWSWEPTKQKRPDGMAVKHLYLLSEQPLRKEQTMTR